MEEMLGVRIRPILRIETLAQDLIVRHARPTSLIDDFEVQVGGARAAGYVALKSIAAYRTGLQIDDVPEREVQAAFASARAEAERAGAVRLRAKPLVDFFVLRALRLAAAQRLPVQFHTGYGDPDLDLRLADPLHLRPLFEDGALESVPIVLLHESYPFTANAAFLAAVYPNAYLDISYSLPPLGRSELRRVTALALDAAPASKIMVSSDGVSIPEHYLLGAVRAREVLADVLGLAVASGELGRAAAEETGRLILRDNAVRVYDLYSDVNQSPV
jgi:predicted TIM-barrel fold metal-dependent hydrolase